MLRYVDTQLTSSTTTTLSEGTSVFDEVRSVLLRETDRSILLASSNFIRSLEGLRASSSSWCVVGLYYSSWYAAQAILGMLGCWMGKPKRWIDVVDANPGKQRLQLHRSPYATHVAGSHRILWHAYYSAVAPLTTWFSPAAALAVTPVSSNKEWFIDLRNKVNYLPSEAFGLMRDFNSNFDRSAIPSCFPGELNSAYQVARSFLSMLSELAAHTGIDTDVFAPSVNRAIAIRQHVNGPHSRDLSAFARGSRTICEF
jgi:hypothetical protein